MLDYYYGVTNVVPNEEGLKANKTDVPFAAALVSKLTGISTTDLTPVLYAAEVRTVRASSTPISLLGALPERVYGGLVQYWHSQTLPAQDVFLRAAMQFQSYQLCNHWGASGMP